MALLVRLYAALLARLLTPAQFLVEERKIIISTACLQAVIPRAMTDPQQSVRAFNLHQRPAWPETQRILGADIRQAVIETGDSFARHGTGQFEEGREELDAAWPVRLDDLSEI